MTIWKVFPPLLLAGFLLATSPVRAQVAPVEQLAEVVVNGEQPGPPLWRVISGDHVLWLLGSVSQLPIGMTWRSKQLENELADSQEVILDWGTASSPRTKAERAALRKFTSLSDGKTLKDILSSELHAQVEVARQTFASRVKGFERLRPFEASNRLIMGSMKPLGLSPFGALHTVSKLAASKGVPVTRMAENEGPASALMVDESSASTTPCLEWAVVTLEKGGSGLRALANAWAVGDIAALRQLVPLYDMSRANPLMVQCDVALHGKEQDASGMDGNHARKWLAAAERALAANKSTVAVIPMAELLAADGYLAQLRAKGYEVVEPREQR